MPNASSASRTSVRCRCRISTANFSIEAPTSARAEKYSACRSRWTICVDTGAGESPSERRATSSIRGERCANVPTAPESFPCAITARARSTRALARDSSSAQTSSFHPKVVGSAWMPCERPMVGVRLCSTARFTTASRARSIPARIRSAASRSRIANEVSSTSELVIPKCRCRAAGPMRSSRKVRKAITSWRVTFSISSMRSASCAVKVPALRAHSSTASRGTRPASAIARAAASSTASHVW